MDLLMFGMIALASGKLGIELSSGILLVRWKPVRCVQKIVCPVHIVFACQILSQPASLHVRDLHRTTQVSSMQMQRLRVQHHHLRAHCPVQFLVLLWIHHHAVGQLLGVVVPVLVHLRVHLMLRHPLQMLMFHQRPLGQSPGAVLPALLDRKLILTDASS